MATAPDVFQYYRRLQQVHEFVEVHLHEAISVARVAAVVGLSEKYFSTFFRQKVGVGFHEWLTCRRLERARAMMADHDYTLTEISFEVGFNDLRTFERNFKRRFGCTARDLRRELQP